MISMQGKRGLIMGVANERSIAWGIAKAMSEAGAELAFTYQGEAFGKRLAPLAASVGSDFMVDVDVTNEASMDAAFAGIKEKWGSIDFIVHAIAYSDKEELTGRFINTSGDNFRNSLTISCFSFIDVARRASEMKTLAGAAIGGARKTFKHTGENAPLGNATLEAVGGTAVYLASDVGSHTTGEVIRVDGGFHVLGMPQPDNL